MERDPIGVKALVFSLQGDGASRFTSALLIPPETIDMKRTSHTGFTLIELLIVVAIIAILAAIAVPNFLEAQTRSKVSRARADMRTIATGLEAYYIDYNKYPAPHDKHNQRSWFGAAAVAEPPFHSRVSSLLTTPVSYLTSLPDDPFRSTSIPTAIENDPNLRLVKRRQIYFNFPFFRAAFTNFNSIQTFVTAERLAGSWFFYSVGPDSDEFNRVNIGNPIVAAKTYIDYDATNGTLSRGNLFRTQKSGERLGVDPLFQ